jgi:SAM-dependent methyltransferase
MLVVARCCHEGSTGGASPWLAANAALLPGEGRALDVACGRGRDALWLAGRGLWVRAIDRDQDSLDALRHRARDHGVALEAQALDLEAGVPDLGSGYALIVVMNYLHRPLFPVLREALAPDGLLVYETFLESHGERRRPSRPEHLLKAGELPHLVCPLEIVAQREGEYGGRLVSSIVARVLAAPTPASLPT